MKKIITILFLAIANGFPPVVFAQIYPTKPISIIVPFPSGGTTDILARELVKKIQSSFSYPVVIVNKDGASGIIGSELVSRSIGDAHLLLLTATHHVINPSLYISLPYDTKKAFTPIALIGVAPNILVANLNFPANNINDLIQLAKANPGSISFASSGIGGANHLSGELLKSMTGIEITHVPYRGASPALKDVIAGHLPIMFDGVAAVAPQLQEGRIKALGITSLKRSPLVPNLPTFNESGVKGYEVNSWFGLYGAPKLPQSAVDRLSSEFRSALASDEIRDKFNRLGVTPGNIDQLVFANFVESELKKWESVAISAKIIKQ